MSRRKIGLHCVVAGQRETRPVNPPSFGSLVCPPLHPRHAMLFLYESLFKGFLYLKEEEGVIEVSESIHGGSIEARPSANIENIVATVSLDQELDLRYIERVILTAEYNPEQFPGLVYRLDDPRVTALIFKSGKMVVTGAKSTADLIEAVKKIVRNLKKHGIPLKGRPKVQIQNIVASANLGVCVDLEKAALTLENSMYEPEQFPGLIYRMDEPRVVLLIFGSGKMVITGAKREEEVYMAVKNIYEKLKRVGAIRPCY